MRAIFAELSADPNCTYHSIDKRLSFFHTIDRAIKAWDFSSSETHLPLFASYLHYFFSLQLPPRAPSVTNDILQLCTSLDLCAPPSRSPTVMEQCSFDLLIASVMMSTDPSGSDKEQNYEAAPRAMLVHLRHPGDLPPSVARAFAYVASVDKNPSYLTDIFVRSARFVESPEMLDFLMRQFSRNEKAIRIFSAGIAYAMKHNLPHGGIRLRPAADREVAVKALTALLWT
jgi:hypothetical protein